MEDPVSEIRAVIYALTTGSAYEQRQTLERYFLPNASFDHPLCFVPEFFFPIPSRSVVLAIYRFYKQLSPNIEIQVHSVAFDKSYKRLYVDITQIFRFFYLPPVLGRVVASLVTVIYMEERDGRWYVRSQKDLYQVEQWVGFFPVVGLASRQVVRAMKLVGSVWCVVFSAMLWSLGYLLAKVGMGETEVSCDEAQEAVLKLERKLMIGTRAGEDGHPKA